MRFHLRKPLARKDRAFTVLELIIVVAILGVLSTAAVPYGQFAYIREIEDQLRANHQDIRLAIARWKEDCQKTVDHTLGNDAWKIPDYMLYPDNIGQLTNGNVHVITHGIYTVNFYHIPYISKIPDDPFVGRAVWRQHFARQVDLTKTNIWDMGSLTEDNGPPLAGERQGMMDISPIGDPTERKGFLIAIDGSKFEDW
jgi:prepilin-type N-terminal cleavage/methylation domain-containing protein